MSDIEKDDPLLSDSDVNVSFDSLDILHATSDAAAFLNSIEIEELENQERSYYEKHSLSQSVPLARDSHEDDERRSVFNILTSYITGQSFSPGQFIEQITTSILRAVGSSSQQDLPKIRESDFKNSPHAHTLHQIPFAKYQITCTIKEYYPQVFRSLREEYFRVPKEDYIREWTLSDEQLSASEGAGRSGALFCFSTSRKFIFKTIFRSEVATLLGFMKHYYNHCVTFPDTLIMRMVGLYRFSHSGSSSEVFVLIFGNVTWSGPSAEPGNLPIHEVYDLKGRCTKTLKFTKDEESDKGVRKDKHLSRLFYTGAYRKALHEQLVLDVNILKSHNLMDYSLLVGVHQISNDDDHPIEPDPDHPSCMGTSKFRQYRGGFPANGEVFFIGIIDCLTFYSMAKKIAHSFKSILWNKVQLSTVQAQFYAERFLHYMDDVFPAGDAPSIHPFIPCQVTGMEQNMPLIVSALKEITRKPPNKTPQTPHKFHNKQYTRIERHDVVTSTFSGEAVKLTVKDYAPEVFETLRALWGITAEEFSAEWEVPYLQIQATASSIVDDSGRVITNLPSTSKKFLLETIQQRDVHELMQFLGAYTPFVIAHPDTLLSRYVGMFKFSITMLNRVYVVVYVNPEYCPDAIPYYSQRIYSLQGVQPNAHPIAPEANGGNLVKTPLYFDRHLDRTFELGSQREELLEILKRDVEFLKSNQAILYNLVVYVGSIVENSDGSKVDPEQVRELKRGLVYSSFGEWVLFGGIQTLWKKFDLLSLSHFSSMTRSKIFRRQDTTLVVSPEYYAERFIRSMEQHFSH